MPESMRGNEHQREQRMRSLSSTRDAQEQCNQKLSHMPHSPAHHAPQLLGPGFSCQRVPGPARAPSPHTPPHTPLTNHPEVRPPPPPSPEGWRQLRVAQKHIYHLSRTKAPTAPVRRHTPTHTTRISALLTWFIVSTAHQPLYVTENG